MEEKKDFTKELRKILKEKVKFLSLTKRRIKISNKEKDEIIEKLFQNKG